MEITSFGQGRRRSATSGDSRSQQYDECHSQSSYSTGPSPLFNLRGVTVCKLAVILDHDPTNRLAFAPHTSHAFLNPTPLLLIKDSHFVQTMPQTDRPMGARPTAIPLELTDDRRKVPVPFPASEIGLQNKRRHRLPCTQGSGRQAASRPIKRQKNLQGRPSPMPGPGLKDRKPPRPPIPPMPPMAPPPMGASRRPPEMNRGWGRSRAYSRRNS